MQPFQTFVKEQVILMPDLDFSTLYVHLLRNVTTHQIDAARTD